MLKSNVTGAMGPYQSPVCRIVNLRVRHSILTVSEDIYAAINEAGKEMFDDDLYNYDL